MLMVDRDPGTVVHQRHLKFRCWRLRDQFRQARADDKNIAKGQLNENDLSYSRYQLLQKYRSNDLARELDEATTEHGFGDLRQEKKSLRAPVFA